MKNLGIFFVAVGTLTAWGVSGCDEFPGERLVFPRGDGVPTVPGLPTGLGVGEDCSTMDCRPGLSCNAENECEPGMSLPTGSMCLIGPECEDGNHCAPAPCSLGLCPTCVPAGDGELGDACQTDLDCASGLRCGLNGFSAECQIAGTGDLGAPCFLQNDCYQGLFCADGQCSPPQPPLGVPLWEGVSCPAPTDNDVEALFFVPGANGSPENATYFDHPYPSDIRLSANGRPDLNGFPSPGPGLVGVDIVAKYVEAIETSTRGWSTNPTVIFRFSGEIDLDSLAAQDGRPRKVFLSDVDDLPATAEEGYRTFSYQYSTGGRTNYVCDDWFALRTPRDTLVPGHRYVAWLTTDLRSEQGEEIRRSPQFAAMLSDSAPASGSGLRAAYEAFKPLRDYLAFYEGSSNEIDPDSILIATVFTTDNVLQPMRQLKDAVQAEPVPTASDWVLCGGGVPSPCPQADAAEGRACGNGTSDYDEYHALLEIPIFQEGTPPYLQEGGSIAASAVRTEEICMSMSIPKGTAPASGWPLVIYGHGTGGSFRGPIRNSVAGRLARATPAFATLGFDEVQHGPRRGQGEDAENDPENLFFNFLNPDAARGNPLQGAADVLSVYRFASQGTLATGAQTGGSPIVVDPDHILLFGHSQGSTHGSMSLPFTPMTGGVLSGNGGGLAEALMNKSNPVNIAGAIPYVVQDADSQGRLRMGEKHPVLGLLQHYVDPSDPINFAPLLGLRPEPGTGPKSVFQTFGIDDTYSPPTTLAGFIYAARMALAPHPSGVNPTGNNALRMTPEAGPVSGNMTLGPDTVTLVCRQYEPASGSDGHFVVDEVQVANDDAIAFLESLGTGTLPTIPAP